MTGSSLRSRWARNGIESSFCWRVVHLWRVGQAGFRLGQRAADRFARASFYVNAIPKSEDVKIALASVLSVVRNVSVPFGISTPGEPNISSTRWRTVAHHTRKLYFFESALTPNVFWVDLAKLDFAEGAPVRKLALGSDDSNVFAGETSASSGRS